MGMDAKDTLFLTGTVGFFAFILLGLDILRSWKLSAGTAWLLGPAGALALLGLAALGGYVFIGTVRLIVQGHWLSQEDARLINGAAPWIAFTYLAAVRRYEREDA